MAEAFRLAQVEREQRIAHLLPLRDRIIARLLEEIPTPTHRDLSQRLPTCQLRLPPVTARAADDAGCGRICLLVRFGLQDRRPGAIRVLTSLGFSREWALGSLRVTLGPVRPPNRWTLFWIACRGWWNAFAPP